MRPVLIVVLHPLIQVLLQHFNGAIDFLAKCYLIKLIENGAPFAKTGFALIATIKENMKTMC